MDKVQKLVCVNIIIFVLKEASLKMGTNADQER